LSGYSLSNPDPGARNWKKLAWLPWGGRREIFLGAAPEAFNYVDLALTSVDEDLSHKMETGGDECCSQATRSQDSGVGYELRRMIDFPGTRNFLRFSGFGEDS
jgi:hypothetical protein